METYNVKLNAFEGPMDLLMHLIDKHKINIYDIPISDLTKQYLDYLDKMKSFDIEISSGFLIMAATLLQIKSRMLLPKRTEENDGEDEDPRLELVRRIIEYRRFKEVTQILTDMVSSDEQFCARNPASIPTEYMPPENIPLGVLIDAFKAAIKAGEDVSIPEVIVARSEFNIEDKMEEVIKVLKKFNGEVLFSDIFKNAARTEFIIIFLAVLELIRNNKIRAKQKYNFAEIHIVLKEEKIDEK